MRGVLFAGGQSLFQEEHARFVSEGEGGEVAGMGACGFKDEGEFLAEAGVVVIVGGVWGRGRGRTGRSGRGRPCCEG